MLKDNLLFEICKLFSIEDIYIDVFGVNNRKNLTEKLLEKNASLTISQIDKSNDLATKATVKDIPLIAEVLSEFDFDDMNIWDCYTEWEQYLKDKVNHKVSLFKPSKVKNDSKFYLNYNPAEGQKVEIICYLIYDKQDLSAKISDLIN